MRQKWNAISAHIMLNMKHPAAIRLLDGTGKVPVTDDKDGRHPNT